MAVLELLRAVVFPLQTLLMLVVPVALALERLRALLEVQAARPALLALRALRLLLGACLDKVGAAVAVVMLALAVQAVLAVVALAVVAAAQHAVHTPLALVVWVVLAGHWYWSIDNAAICRC